MSNKERVKVAVRCRPLNSTEKSDSQFSIIDITKERGEVAVKQLDETQLAKTFFFDNVYDSNTKQETVFNETALPIIESVMEGYNGTIFAYGQTGTGKTHTMEGTGSDIGIIPRSFKKIFELIKLKSKSTNYIIRVTYLEIYNEKIRDLLVKSNGEAFLDIREDKEKGFYVENLKEFAVTNPEEMTEIQRLGSKQRAVAGHDMNARSSRSHTIFTIIVDNGYIDTEGKEHIKTGKLNLVDLAGSERQKKTGAKGELFEQAIHINQSLSTLGNVISALVTGKKHIPYRDSKLTKMLSDSLGGNSKTVMIANIGPANKNHEETVTTLRYADRAKQIKNKPKINEDPKDSMIRQYQEELAKLKEELAMAIGGNINPNNQGTEFKYTDENGNVIQTYVDKEKLKEMELKFKQDKLEMEQELENEKKKIVESKNTAEDEKINLLEKLKKKQNDKEKKQKKKEEILKKLKIFEDKFIIGEETEKKAKENEAFLLNKQKELEEEEKKRLELQLKIKDYEEMVVNIKSKYTDHKAEIKDKEKIYKKLKVMLKEAEVDKEECEEDVQKELTELYDVKRGLEKQISYNDAIINYFIPMDYLDWIESQMQYNDITNEWSLPNFNLGQSDINKDLTSHVAMGLHDDESLFSSQRSVIEASKNYEDISSSIYLNYEGTDIGKKKKNKK